MAMLVNSPDSASLPMELPLMSSAAGSHAKTYPSLVAASVLKAPVLAYGQKCGVSFAILDPLTSWWKTSEVYLLAPATSLVDGSVRFSQTWPRSGMMRNGIAYQRPLSVLHTCATGFGLWPTPNKSNGFTPFSMQTMLRKQRGETRPSGCKMGFDLKWEPRCVPYLVNGWINPKLTEWLMGFPIGHTDLLNAGTP